MQAPFLFLFRAKYLLAILFRPLDISKWQNLCQAEFEIHSNVVDMVNF